MIRLLLNILWFIFGGFISGCLWLLGGALLAITIVGLPYAGAAWRIAGFAFWPFGKEIVPRELVTGREDLGTGGLGCVLERDLVRPGRLVHRPVAPDRRRRRGRDDHRHPVRHQGPAAGRRGHRPDRPDRWWIGARSR